MNFTAIDVETANADMASICQIGLVKYQNDTLRSYLEDMVIVCHSHFDRVAIYQATRRYGINAIECTWLDSARVARRAWKGYGLYNVCKNLGYEFKHHDALEDAKAAAHIILAATKESGLDINGWLKRVRQPIDPMAGSSGSAIKREGKPEGALYSEILVFTGALEIPRREAANLAASIGCQVASGVTKETTMLVVGNQDIKKLQGHEKSSKHRKAEELIEKGVQIRILKESDFRELAKLSDEIA